MKTIINNDLKAAIKRKDSIAMNVLRALKTAISNAETAKGYDGKLNVIAIIKTEIKRRNASVLAFTEGNRMDLVDIETKEINILTGYLPKQLSDIEIDAIVTLVINTFDSPTMRDMGKIIAKVKAIGGDSLNMKVVSTLVKQKLN